MERQAQRNEHTGKFTEIETAKKSQVKIEEKNIQNKSRIKSSLDWLNCRIEITKEQGNLNRDEQKLPKSEKQENH